MPLKINEENLDSLKINFDTVDMFRLRDGKLCEHWDVADTRALFTQVGGLKEING